MMRRVAAALVTSALSTGCVTAQVGIDAPLAEDRAPSAAIELRAGAEGRAALMGAIVRTRIGEGGAEVGLATDFCIQPEKFYVRPRLCGRILPIELGSHRGEFVLGTGSFAIGPGVWIPIQRPGPRKYDTGYFNLAGALWIQGWAGLDVRPLEDKALVQTFGIRIGGGQGMVFHRPVKE